MNAQNVITILKAWASTAQEAIDYEEIDEWCGNSMPKFVEACDEAVKIIKQARTMRRAIEDFHDRVFEADIKACEIEDDAREQLGKGYNVTQDVHDLRILLDRINRTMQAKLEVLK